LKGEVAEVDDPNDLQVADFTFNLNRKEILENNFGGYWNYEVLDFCFIRNMYSRITRSSRAAEYAA